MTLSLKISNRSQLRTFSLDLKIVRAYDGPKDALKLEFDGAGLKRG